MSSSRTSSPLTLRIAATAFGTLGVAFGVNAILRPAHALTFFEMMPPTSATDRRVVDALMAVYGVRDIFMGVATYAAAYYGHRKALGWIVLATGGVAFADGLICKLNGQGKWNHWSYAPIVAAFGCLLLAGY
ncbi:putative integral membrane protein [Auricularia subglabra TFB-10046 SS5]|uniref:Putative integral membrane protein n=1 Tax=Auricularia subglabra (strain TFB-10046 / SS5) TaxID=717982 RepID=J0DBC5_AURST|nr:putative integral membrane protein [Auricularia subglabra TFB-10046 SS5]